MHVYLNKEIMFYVECKLETIPSVLVECVPHGFVLCLGYVHGSVLCNSHFRPFFVQCVYVILLFTGGMFMIVFFVQAPFFY